MKTPSAPINTQIMKLTSKYTNALSSVGQCPVLRSPPIRISPPPRKKETAPFPSLALVGKGAVFVSAETKTARGLLMETSAPLLMSSVLCDAAPLARGIAPFVPRGVVEQNKGFGQITWEVPS